MLDALRAAVAEVLPEVVGLRHELHRHPEIRFQEHWTSGRIAAWLDERGIPYTRGHAGGTGIVAHIPGHSRDDLVLRADIDALEIEEQTGVDYCSEYAGRMHACGHDGHTAILCGAAHALWQVREQLPCGVRCVFQPAEEEAAGGRLIVEEGLIDGALAAFALHGWPSLPAGSLCVGPGPVMASADAFEIFITGRGGHAADPSRVVDPVVIAAHVVTALQTVVSRGADPWEAVVLSVTRVEAGHTGNIIPETALVAGTLRTLSAGARADALAAIERIASGMAAAWGAVSTCTIGKVGYPATINDPDLAAYAGETASLVLGAESTSCPEHPFMTAEDFGYYLQAVPGAFAFLGTGSSDGKDSPGLHTPYYDFNDASLQPGILYMASLAARFEPARWTS